MTNYRNYGKVAKTPRRPYEKERLDRELKLVGEYGQTAQPLITAHEGASSHAAHASLLGCVAVVHTSLRRTRRPA